MRIGRLDRMATLDTVAGDSVTFSPDRVPVGLKPSGSSSENVVGWLVETRYHPQVTMNTRLTLDDGRKLFVRGFANYGNADRSGWDIWTCEEVLTP